MIRELEEESLLLLERPEFYSSRILNRISSCGDTLLLVATGNRSSKVSLKLLEYKGIVPSYLSFVLKNGVSAFLRCCVNGLEKVAFRIIELWESFGGDDRIYRAEHGKRTVLHFACRAKLEKLALYIVKHMGFPSIEGKRNGKGCTALILACFYGLPELALHLARSSSSNPWHSSDSGCTAIGVAKQKGMLEVTEALYARKIFELGECVFPPLEKLPKTKILELVAENLERFERKRRKVFLDKKCPVCLEEIEGEATSFGCGHIFHTVCSWKIKRVCPICRKAFC